VARRARLDAGRPVGNHHRRIKGHRAIVCPSITPHLNTVALLARQPINRQSGLVVMVDLLADPGTDHADVAGRLAHADHVLERAGKLADQAAQEEIAFQGQRQFLDLGPISSVAACQRHLRLQGNSASPWHAVPGEV
jgi:hypothetical protein